MKELLHFDPLNLIVVVLAAVGAYFTLQRDSKWHTQWIQKHDKECDEQRTINTGLFTELKSMSAHLATLTEAHEKRLDRAENYIDNVRI